MGFTNKYVIPLLQENAFLVAISIVIGAASLFFLMRKNKKEVAKQPPKKVNLPNSEDDEPMDDQKLVPPLWSEDIAHVPYVYEKISHAESLARSEKFYQLMNSRRSLRFFSTDHVPDKIVKNIIKTAGTSPSGAHTEPWIFVAVKDAELKEQIREIVENEEEMNYTRRMGSQWTSDLKAIRTTWKKEYLAEAPWLLLIFRQSYFPMPDGRRRVNYYNEISTAISAGIMLAAIQNAGLATLTSTPLNCGPALRNLLGRPSHEKLVMLLPVGYPKEDATVPDFVRKPVEEIYVVI